jgi:hypothetical protein
MIQNISEKVYKIKDPTTFIYQMLMSINNELCESKDDLIKARNDIYLWNDVTAEPVIKGVLNGTDCLQNRAVAEIITVGNTPGASDFFENVDFTRVECGILWAIPDQYYGGYAYYGGYGGYGGYGWTPYYNQYYPYGRAEPPTGSTYYVTYRYGCRDENLYNNFGIFAKLKKQDIWSYPQYRQALKAMILAYIGGPSVENIRDALSVFHTKAYIEITELYKTGWIIDKSILYTSTEYEDSAIDTSDGCILVGEAESLYTFIVRFHFSETMTALTKTIITQIIGIIKPAHTRALIQYLIGY